MEIYIGGPNHNDYDRHCRHHHTTSTTIKSPKALIWFGIIDLIFLALIGYFYFFGSNLFNNKDYIETIGIIVDNHGYFNEDSGAYMYNEIAEFEVDGVKYTVTNNTSSTIPGVIGKEVVVKYRINNPKDAMFKQSSLFMIFMIVMIVVFAVFGLGMIVSGIKKLKCGETVNIENNSASNNKY